MFIYLLHLLQRVLDISALQLPSDCYERVPLLPPNRGDGSVHAAVAVLILRLLRLTDS